MAFVFKSFQKIVGDQISYISANTPINDMTPGSVILNLIEMNAQEIYQQYIQLVNIIQSYNLDTTTGEDLENRALEYGIIKQDASAATGYVTIGDSGFTKVVTNIYAGSNGAVSGQVILDINDSTNFSASGAVIVGRGTVSEETVSYLSITDNTTYYTLNLDPLTPLTNDHKVGETVILSQGGLRTVLAGTTVLVPMTNISEEISFTTNEDTELSDGEDSVSTTIVTCQETGTVGNIPIGAIVEFDSAPFPNATATNEEAYTNGKDEETDNELRGRIRDHIQSLSMGTETAITFGVSGLTNVAQTKRVVSSNYLEGLTAYDVNYLYIDDGTGFEPTFSGKAIEYVVRSAAGTEKIVQLDNFPLVKASLITQSEQPFNINSGDKLRVAVNDVEEELIFLASDFTNEGATTAREIAIAINDGMTLVEARTTGSNNGVIMQAVAEENENIKVLVPATGTNANDNLQFEEDVDRYTLKLYKDDLLLNKDGATAFVDTVNTAPFVLADAQTLTLYIDDKTDNLLTITFHTGDFVDITQATAAEVVSAINADLPGGYASSILDGSEVRIYSRTKSSEGSYVEVTGGTANAGLAFPTDQVQGADNDYVLNKCNGQIELTEELNAEESLKAGTIYTEAFLECASSEDYTIVAAETLVFNTDALGAQTIPFVATGTYTAQQVADLINADTSVNGIYAYVITKGSDIYLRVATNTLDDSIGSIVITTTPAGLDFTTGVTVTNQEANLAYIEPENVEDYTLGPDQNLVVVLDQDASDRVFNFVISLSGTVTNSVSNVLFDSTNISTNYSDTNDFFAGYMVRFTDTTTTVALRGYIREVSTYNGILGRITIAAGEILPAVPVVGDSFDLIPVTAKHMVDYLNNTQITPFSVYADTKLIKGATKPQINTQTEGSVGAVQITGGTANKILIPFTSVGTVAGNFEVDNIEGLFEGVGDAPVAAIYYGGMRVTLDNVLNSFTYDFLTDPAPLGNTFTCASARYLQVDEGCVIKDDNTQTYLNGYVDDITVDGGQTIDFSTNGNVQGEFDVAVTDPGTVMAVGDLVVLNSTTEDAYTNGYVYARETGGPGPWTVTIYDSDTREAKDLTDFLIADTSVILYTSYTISIFDRTTTLAHDISAFTTGQNAEVSSIYDKGYIRDITADPVSLAEPYTITIYDETSLNVVADLQTYTLSYGAVLKDRNNFDFDTNVVVGVDGYKYYTGLLQEVQWKVDGLPASPIDYPGIKAAGPQIQVAAPTVRPIKLSLDITTLGDITVGSIENDIKTQISLYINNLGVGDDVVLSEIIDKVQNVIGVYDVKITSPLINIVISDNERARVISSDITLA